MHIIFPFQKVKVRGIGKNLFLISGGCIKKMARPGLFGRKRKVTKQKAAKRQMVTRVPRSVKQTMKGNVMHASETIISGDLLYGVGRFFQFKMDNLPQIASYQNLYRSYRLNGVGIKIFSNYVGSDGNQILANTAAVVPWIGAPRINYRINRAADLAAPANEGDILVKGAKTWQMDKPLKFYIRNPKYFVDANPGGVTTEKAYGSGLLDLANSADVLHNGLELMPQALNASASNLSYRILFTYYFTLYGTK